MEKRKGNKEELKEALHKSEQSERRLLMAQRVGKMGFIEWNLKSDEVYWSDELFRLYGADPEKVKPAIEPVLERVHPHDLGFVKENLDLALKGKKKYDIYHRNLFSDGKVMWVHARGELKADRATFFVTIADTGTLKAFDDRALEVNKRLQYLLTSRGAVIYTSKASGDYGATFVSENIDKMTGYESKDFLENPEFWIEHVHPDDRARLLFKLSRSLESSVGYHEYRFRCHDGSYIWLCDELTVMKDEKGNPQEIVGCLTDISRTKKIEREAVRGEQNIFTLMEMHKRRFNSDEEIFAFVLKQSLICTASRFSFIGLMSEDAEMIAYSFSREANEVNDANDERCVEKKTGKININEAGVLKDVIRKGYPIIVNDCEKEIEEGQRFYPDRHVLIERLLCVPVFDGVKLVAVAAVANKSENYDDVDLRAIITMLDEMWQMVKNVKSLSQLKEREEHFRTFLQLSPSAVFAADLSGNITYWSRRLSDLTGMTAPDAMGKGWEKCLHPDESDRVIEALEGVMRDRREYKSEHRFVTLDKKVLWGLLQVSPIMTSGSEVSGYVGNFTEITEKKMAEEAMESRLEELECFRKATVQREFRMKELKDENLKLRGKIMELRSAGPVTRKGM